MDMAKEFKFAPAWVLEAERDEVAFCLWFSGLGVGPFNATAARAAWDFHFGWYPGSVDDEALADAWVHVQCNRHREA